MRSLAYKTTVLIVVVVPLLATGLAINLLWARAVHWPDLAILLTMYALVAFGVTVGYHRMLTHRSFRPNPVVKTLLLILGSMALEGDALQWAATHTKHHALSDRAGDPHSPVDGFFHAHLGWIFAESDARSESLRSAPGERPHRPVRQPHLPALGGAGVWRSPSSAARGGWRAAGLLWGGLVRIFLTHHVTWSVNSVCHTFGKRAFETNDRSRNEWIVGLLGFGEGWHNNHHAFPRSAFHGLRWWQFDLSGYLIWGLERVGLAHEVYRVPQALQARRATRSRCAPSHWRLSRSRRAPEPTSWLLRLERNDHTTLRGAW